MVHVANAFCRSRRAPVALGNALLVGAWLALSRHALAWLGRNFADPVARSNAILLTVAVGALVVQAWPLPRLRVLVQARPQLRALPLGLFILCAVAQGLRVRLWSSNLLGSTAFLLGTHAWLGFYLPAARWRRGFIAVLAVVALLPFGPQLDAFLGFPARVVTAQWVHKLLGALGVPVQSAEAIVILENGVASIDLPCSGVKGLWVGGVFFLGLTWLDGRPFGWRWLLGGLAFLAALAAANVLRVLLIVVIGFAWGRPALANLVHLPLGVFGFVVACSFAVLWVRRLPKPVADPARTVAPTRPLGVALVPLVAVLLLLAATCGRASSAARGVGAADLHWPPTWAMTALPLDDKETQLFHHHGVARAGKWRFRAADATGTLLVVVADSFRAHHAPEVCLASAGHKLDGIRRAQLGPGRPLHLIDLGGHQATAATWFQSARTTTDSLLQRSLAEFVDGDRRWALVSVLFDGPTDLDAPTRALLENLHQAVAASLTSHLAPRSGEGSPSASAAGEGPNHTSPKGT